MASVGLGMGSLCLPPEATVTLSDGFRRDMFHYMSELGGTLQQEPSSGGPIGLKISKREGRVLCLLTPPFRKV